MRTCEVEDPEAAIEEGSRFDRDAVTDDELEVVDLVARGLTDHAIARRLSVSIVTVRRRATSFRRKVRAVNRAEAIAIGAGLGWVEHPAVRAFRSEGRGVEDS